MAIIAPPAVATPQPDPKDPDTLRDIRAALHGLNELTAEQELEQQNLVYASKAVMHQVDLLNALIRRMTPHLITNEGKLDYMLEAFNGKLDPLLENLLRSLLVPTERGFFTSVLDLNPPGGNS